VHPISIRWTTPATTLVSDESGDELPTARRLTAGPPPGFVGDSPLPPVWAYDDHIPGELAARWTASDENTVLAKDFVRSMAVIGGVLLMAAGLVALVAGPGVDVLGVLSAVVGVLALWAARHARRRDRRISGAFYPREVDLILAHRRQVRFDDWDGLTGQDAPREVVAARRAGELARELVASPGWTCDQLAMHRMRLRPAEEARQIQLTARDIHDRGRILARSTAVDVPGGEMDVAKAEWRRLLDMSFTALDARLVAFHSYVSEVTEVAALIGQAEAAHRLTTQLLIEEPAMAIDAVVHEQAADQVGRLRQELLELRADLGPMPSPPPTLQDTPISATVATPGEYGVDPR